MFHLTVQFLVLLISAGLAAGLGASVIIIAKYGPKPAATGGSGYAEWAEQEDLLKKKRKELDKWR